ncbi:FliI/YscN family ATPase [Schlesneria sp. T3-172]|uniref:FliI/YscN family ATPase n=1 Tax=Schlesneria sphaerica TaxID=3373610 RepID=UPI0037CC3A83
MLALEDHLRSILPISLTGRVTRIVGLTLSVSGFPAPLGAIAKLETEAGSTLEAEVIGFSGEETLLLPYGDPQGIRRGTRAVLGQSVQIARVGDALLGRIVNGRGDFIDGLPPAILPCHARLQATPISPMSRPRIDQPLATGVRSVDGLITCAKGQRLGIFAGSGVGKSTLLGQIARSTSADVNVVVLIGERGREVREFIERDLGPEGAARSVVVVATGDDPVVLRLRAAYLGTAIAEYFRDSGRDVLLMMDSVTRFALAHREIGLAAGEPPANRGYPPSVFSHLAKLLERTGRTETGSITGFYTVLVEGDDHNEPISDTVRGTLDGHIVLSRKLAQQSHFPAIDVLASLSRLMPDVTDVEHRLAANSLRQWLAAYQQAEDLISIGAYQRGSNSDVDAAIRLREPIQRFLRQAPREHATFSQAVEELQQLLSLNEEPVDDLD